MVSKKELLIKSIRELLALNVPDEEIKLNLKEVGISSSEGQALIKEARQPDPTVGKSVGPEKLFEGKKPPAPNPAEKSLPKPLEKPVPIKEKEKAEKEEKAEKIEEERKDVTEELAAVVVQPEENVPIEEIAEEIAEGKKKILVGPEIKQPKIGLPKILSEKPEAKLVEDVMISKLWEKGILGTVNERLSEMKELKEELDSVLDKKVEKASRRDMEKIKVLFESQRALTVSKVDSEIESKAKVFADMIELKLREMRGINKEIAGKIDDLHKVEKRHKVEQKEFEERLKGLDKLKQELVSSLNSEIIKSKGQSKQLIGEMNQKLQEMDLRINKTLQLENQIVEGLVKGAEQKVEEMLDANFVEVKKYAHSQQKSLEEIKNAFGVEQEQRLASLEQNFRGGMLSLDKKVEAKLRKLDKLHKAITVDFKPGEFKVQMNELLEFKVQFIHAIKNNVTKFNEGIRKLNKQSEIVERQFMLRAEKIDKKIKELDLFEKKFAEEMGLSLEKVAKGKK